MLFDIFPPLIAKNDRFPRTPGTFLRALATFCFLLFLCIGLSSSVHARNSHENGNLPIVALSDLPTEAQSTYRRILVGGPFPYEKDGTVFGNRERLLPQQRRGYYREYTVRTPWVKHRGARRIVCGGSIPMTPDACYYTDDHYNSFSRILVQPR